MSLTDEIDDIYIKYLLLNKQMHLLCQQTKKSRAILNKYIAIKENLDLELYPLLNDRKKMTQDIALFLSKEVLNPLVQCSLYSKIKTMTTKQKKEFIKESQLCHICACSTTTHEFFPCCGNTMCSKCLYKLIEETVMGLCVKKIGCPFCRKELSIDSLQNFLHCFRTKKTMQFGYGDKKRYKKIKMYYTTEPWRQTDPYKQKIYFDTTSMINLFNNYIHIYQSLSTDGIDPENFHYGYCHRCIENVYLNRSRYKQSLCKSPRLNPYKRLHIAEVPKDCAQVVKEDMFLCGVCQSNEEEYNVIKSCPHCGIKTIKPTNCNYVCCQCGGKWCYVCNMRLPNTHEGHNVHFWIGNGSSPYDNHCRISENYEGETHVLETCDCSHCKERKGRPMCISIDCQKPSVNLYNRQGETLYKLHCLDCYKHKNQLR